MAKKNLPATEDYSEIKPAYIQNQKFLMCLFVVPFRSLPLANKNISIV